MLPFGIFNRISLDFCNKPNGKKTHHYTNGRNWSKRNPTEIEFYGDLVYKLKKIVDSNNFSAQFIKIISHYKKDWL